MSESPTAQERPALQISAGLLGFAAELSSQEGTRYYLNGVYVEPCAEGGVTATATDGHRLISIRDPDGHIDRPLILRAAKPFLAECRRYPTTPVIARELSVRFIAERIPQKRGQRAGYGIVETIDGTFPNWRALVPQKMPDESVVTPIRARYLSAFAGLAGADRHSGAIMVVSGTKDGPSFVFPASKGVFDWVGIVMPMRGDDIPSSLPAWLGLPSAEARAA